MGAPKPQLDDSDWPTIEGDLNALRDKIDKAERICGKMHHAGERGEVDPSDGVNQSNNKPNCISAADFRWNEVQ